MEGLSLVELIESAIPQGTTKMLAQFNATSGAFITCISLIDRSFLNTTHFEYVEVDIDLSKQTIKGTLKNHKVVNLVDEPTVVYESKINDLCRAKIYKRFSPEVQLDIMRVALANALDKLGVVDDALLDMNEYIDSVKRANVVMKNGYISNPDFKFISIDEENAINEAKLDGGLHEIMGPKNLIDNGY